MGFAPLVQEEGHLGGTLRQPAIVVDAHLKPRDLVVVPFVKGLNHGKAADGKEFVEVAEARLIDAADREPPRPEGRADEIGVDAVAHTIAQFVGHVARDEDGATRYANRVNAALLEPRAEKVEAVFLAHPLQHKAEEIVVGTEDGGLGGIALHMAHARHARQRLDERIADGNGRGFVGQRGVEAADVDMGVEADDLRAYLVLEAQRDGDGDYHHRQAYRHATLGNHHSRTRHPAMASFTLGKAT